MKNVLSYILPSLILIILIDYVSSYFVENNSLKDMPSENYFTFDNFQMWKLKPKFNNNEIIISDEGFRCENEININKKLIFIIGGSTTFGLGVNNNQTVSYYLKQLIDEKHSGYQVVNAGVTGYYSTQELIHIQRNIIKYGPEMVIALTGRNDAFYSLHPQYKEDAIPYHGQIREKVGALDPYYVSDQKYLTPFHFEKIAINLARTTKLNWAREWDYDGLDYDNKAIDLFVRNQQSIYFLLKGYNIDYHLFLQPTVNYPQRNLHKNEIEYITTSYLEALNDGYKHLFTKANEALDPTWYHGFIYLDNNEQDFIDNVHFSPTGAERVANSLYSHIFLPVGSN